MTAAGRAIVREQIRRVSDDAFAAPPDETLSAWADANYRLPGTSAESGAFQTDRIPYLRGILDALGDDTIQEVAFAKSSQVAGSTCGEILIAHRIVERPCAILSIWPTEKKLRQWSRTRLEPMIGSIPAVAARMGRIDEEGRPKKRGRREAGDSLDMKEFAGGFLACLTSKSTSDMKSIAAPVLVLEELDEWVGDLSGQGDPEELAERAARTFPLRKIFRPSTPTLDGHSRIWRHLERSTWHEYWVPCPHCTEFQTLRWRDGDEDLDAAGSYRLVWEKDADEQLIPGTTCYVCVHCGALIEERLKMAMLERGEWRARFPQRRAVGFHINTLYSPLCAWDDIASKFLVAKGNPEKMKSFVNTWLGLPYREKGESIDSHYLTERAESYGEGVDVPDGVGCLTAGVDVQGMRIEVVVWGWGAREESWVIHWEQIDGDPGQEDVWDALDALLLRGWKTKGGAPLRIAAAAIDARYQSERVHRFCEARTGRRVIPIIGKEGAGRPLIKAPAPKKFKRARTQQRPSHIVGVDSGKSMLMSRLRIKPPEIGNPHPREFVHFRDTLDPVFYEQLTSERLVTTYAKGIPSRGWIKIVGRNNEALDCSVYAMAALTYLGPAVIANLGALAEQIRNAKPEGAAQSQAPQRRVHSKVEW